MPPATYPVAPGKFPDGTQATKDEMLAAKKPVVKYNADMDTYLGCIKSEFDAKVAAQPDAHDRTEGRDGSACRMQKHNAAVEEVTARDRALQRAAARLEGEERRRRRSRS